MPPDTAATNRLLNVHGQELPNLSGLSERDAYFGLGKALIEFESAVCQMEDRILGEEIVPGHPVVSN